MPALNLVDRNILTVTCHPYKNQLLCLLALLSAYGSFAQDTVVMHELKIKPTTDFDQRFYYVPNERQNVWGYRTGILINDRFKAGIGVYYMNQFASQAVETRTLSRTNGDVISIHQKLYLGTVYYEPYLLRKKLWETSLVFETGYGRTINSVVDKTINNIVQQTGLLIPAGIGLSVNFKLPPLFHVQCFRWMGINAMAGYRMAIYQQSKQYRYNGAYWSLSGAVFLDRIFEDFHTWKKQRALVRDSRPVEIFY